MSIFRMPTLSSISTKFEGLRDRMGRRSRLDSKHQKQRRLLMDPLEERQLLSVSPADITDILVNQTVSEDQISLATYARYNDVNWDTPQSMAMDDDGDFVVTWTRYDQVVDPITGQPVIDPVSGEIMRDANVYARYFTDDVQRITFPEELTANNVDGQYGTFSLKYGGNEVQKLTISATHEPSNSGFFFFGNQENIAGGITLGFDVNGSGDIGPSETTTIFYDETNALATSANDIQTALQGLGGALADVTVNPISPKEFEVHFGDLSLGEDQPLLTVEGTSFTNGFLPAVEVEALREPVEIGPIFVSPDDPYLTATSIEEVFRLTTTNFNIGPYEFPPPSGVPNRGMGPYSAPATIRQGVPTVSATPVWENVWNPVTEKMEFRASLTKFELTFDGALGAKEGAAGKIDHPELEFVSATDDVGTPVDVATLGTVRTIKEPSPEFRVNPEEPENPFTPLPDKFDQRDAVVAMDADGDFIIVWESEVPDWQNAGSISDIYARQFTPIGVDAPDELEFVPGIMAQGETFRVNTSTEGLQGDPSVGMDGQGNFTIAWASGAQDLSYFNNVRARRFDRFGDALDAEFQVNSEDTTYHFNPYVASSEDGHTLITWTQTDDERYITSNFIVSSLQSRVYDSNGNLLLTPFTTGGALAPKGAWDKSNNFIITWDQASDNDNVGNTSEGVHAQMFDINGNVIRSEFKVNSAAFDPGRTPFWPYYQGIAQPALDADGDLTIMYEGYGPDVSNNVFINSSFYAEATADPANADLLPFFFGGFILNNIGSSIDVDTAIELELIDAANAGATLEQLGRIRAILDSKAGLLRGEAYGIMYSQFDADPTVGPDNILYSDNIANAQRDGHNQRWILVIDTDSTGGNFTVRMSNPYVGGSEDIQISPVYTNQRLNVGQTRGAIENALRGATRTGVNWPVNAYEGPVEVRTVSTGFGFNSAEILDRQVILSDGSQPWAYPWSLATLADTAVYEITFQGEVHDTGLFLSIVGNAITPDTERFLGLSQYQGADSGLIQRDGNIDIEPDGDYTMVWLQYEEHTSDSDGGISTFSHTGNENIYYRRFDESTDTAGPRVTDVVDPQGNRVPDGATIDGAVRHIVIAFDEALMSGDPDTNPASALNVDNWLLSQDGIAIPGAIAKVEFGLNKAAELSGTYDGVGASNGGMGQVYDISNVPTNKWEAVITLDANGGANAGDPSLGIGRFEITALNSLHDSNGNPLGSIGPFPGGFNMTRTFWVTVDQPDIEIDENVGSSDRTSGTLHPETPNAVAVDADGDHVVVWTAYDSTAGHDRVYMRLFGSDGSPNEVAKVNTSGQFLGFMDSPVIPVTGGPEFSGDVQRHGSVAIDPDGDFVITWTNYRNGDAEVFARKFSAKPSVTIDPNTLDWDVYGDEAFQVNDYTQDDQKWSDVAMDREGNFVVTWTSYAQELNGELGSGYGIYARRYDSEGRALAPESQVNVTTAGDQQTPSVAIAAHGDYVIAWTSDQNGSDDDIIVREFNADGSAKAGPLQGERRVNDIEAGHQRYPDVAMRFDGLAYVVTWTDSAADISGNSVWMELSSPQPKRYLDPLSHLINATHNFTINVGDNFTLADVNVQLGRLYHERLQDLEVRLTHGGVTVVLFDDLPRPSLINGTRPIGSGLVMDQTTLDDQAPSSLRITNTDGGAVPSYVDIYVPQEVLAPFNGLNAQGAWTLTVIDRLPGNGLTGRLEAVSTGIGSWNLDITEDTQQFPDSVIVNSTTSGHQMFSSVAMDTFGEFTVTWSGKGVGSTLTSGHDVYYQRYDRGGTRVGLETLVNLETDGDQWISSIGMDARGNYVIVWTGEGVLPDTNAVFKYDSIRNFPQTDNDGPIVTDVFAGTQRIFNGSVIEANSGAITQMKVVFNEELSILDGVVGQNSVLNPSNWAILRNDIEIVDGVTDIQFSLNPQTNKWEAIVSFDGNGVNFGTPGLSQGEYTLTVRDLITDTSRFIDPDEDTSTLTPGNFLDGDIDGVPGSRPITIGLGGYEHHFSIAPGAKNGPEFRINEHVEYEQRISAPGGLGQAREESNRSVAVDNDGDFAVVWTTYGLDDPNDPNSGGVYVRLFDRNDNPLTGEILVNQNTAGQQRNASIAMDTDGDFVIVWESEGTSLDGSWDVFARRYNSVGLPLGDEFRVNSTTTANQLNPTVAMDDRGAFVVAWATSGQNFSFFNDVYAQLYDRFGETQGPEFRVNVNDLPGVTPFPPGRFEINPAAAMAGPTGDFVIAWEVVVAQQNGVATDTVIAGRLYDSNGAPQTGEIRLDSGVGTGGLDQFRVARNPQMVMNDQGGFYMAWESYVAKAPAFPDDYDVFYSEFNAAGGVVATGQSNLLQFTGHQVNPSIGVDADGDFSVVWNGPGATVDPLFPNNPDLQVDEDDFGVFRLNYNPANQTVGTQTRVNRTQYGPQYQPTIGMEPDGDSIVVWSGVGVGDNHGIFARRYNEPTDTAGPTVSDWADQRSNSLDNGHEFEGVGNEVQYFVLTFDEDMLQTGDDRVTNPTNYALYRGGLEIPGAVIRVEYGLNKASQLSGTLDPLTGNQYEFSSSPTNKYEAILTFDGDLTTTGVQILEDGSYTIQALPARPGFRSGLRDAVGNVLNRTGLIPSGEEFTASFIVQIEEPPPIEDPEQPPINNPPVAPMDLQAILVNQVDSDFQFTTPGQSLAVDGDGDFVVAWTRYDGIDAAGNPLDANIYARYFTDELQRLTLPSQLAEDSDGLAGTLGRFSLEYNAPSIQMLSVTAGILPFTTDDPDDALGTDEVGSIAGSFTLGYDLTGDGTIGEDPGVTEVVQIRDFSERSMKSNSLTIQNALRSLGGVLTGVTVRAVNPRDYLIEFPDSTAAFDVSQITVQSIDLAQSAHLPAVTMQTLREGLVFENVMVSQDDPWATVQSIENVFRNMAVMYDSIGPVDSAPANQLPTDDPPYEAPWWMKTYAPEVQVTPVVKPDGTLSLTDFDITFVGSAGKQDHPQLVVSDARNDQGQTVSVPSDAVTTRKELSNEFRVNPEEYNDPATPGLDAFNQSHPSVAMDADGDFVIVWESEVPSSQNFGSVSDIYARRFTPFGKVNAGVSVPGEIIDIFGDSTGVRTLINPEVQDVQRLIFNADDPFVPLTGSFRLKLGEVITEPISFDSEALRATADDIEAKLADAEINGVTVVQVPTATTGRYRLEVRFGGESAGVDQPTLEYVADVTPLAATVSAQDMAVDMYTFGVNQATSNPQFDPTVAMDESGNFVVAWANGGQTLSFFNHISVQRFNRLGERLGNEFQVNNETTDIQLAPHVALSNSGNYLVSWTLTSDPASDIDNLDTTVSQVRAKVFDPTGNQLVGEFSVGGGAFSSAAFDSADNYVITWHGLFDTDGGSQSLGVHATEYALFDAAGQPNATPVARRAEFRVNSSSTATASATLWPFDQAYAQPAIDADGDLAIIYQGFGPDVSVNVNMVAGYFSQLMSSPANNDLLPFFDPFDVFDRGQEGVPVAMITQFLGNNGDVDGSIDQVLFRAVEMGASDAQLGRLRAIMELTVGQLRGEGNGILVSTWDADPTLSTAVLPLSSDSVVNTYRDGQNQRNYVEIPVQFDFTDSRWYQAERGTFTVQVENLLTGVIETAVVDIASSGLGQPLNIEGTRQNLDTALSGMTMLGAAWPGLLSEGVIDVREVDPVEINDRVNTFWELDAVDETLYEERPGGLNLVQGYRNVLYEITFQGSAHDTPYQIDVIGSATERGGVGFDQQGNPTIGWIAAPAVDTAFFGETYGLRGTEQTNSSIGMEPDGDYVALYTQIENFRNAGFVTNGNDIANSTIYFRRFDEVTDTAGPRVTDWADGNGTALEDDAVLQNHLQYVVLTFDEEMLSGDPAQMADSILNTANFKLFESAAEVPDGVIQVSFGLSKASELAGQVDPLTGQEYGLDPIPSNKWEAVITLDGDLNAAGAQPLRDGFYSFQALAAATSSSTNLGQSGLRDRAGNTLFHTGFNPGGSDFLRNFRIKVTERKDEPVGGGGAGSLLTNGHTHPESPGAIAADADGHYAVVWTATDPTQGNREKVFYRLFDADGSAADLPVVDNQTGLPILGIGGEPIIVEDAYPILPITPSTNILPGFGEFALDTQNHATVAMDKDGDFLVTWTNYRGGDADIYARRFDSLGELAGVDEIGRPVFKGGSGDVGAVSDAFRVNGYTANSQKWSNAAMDVDGDFIITWSSYGQEDNGQFGSGYGVYARRYDSFGQPLAGEFQVNITEAGSQQFSNVAMDSEGGFTIAWTSDQNGISDDIVVRDFNADGTPVGGPLGGELVANQTLPGDQRYPDIAMNLAGDQYVVTWSASGQDGSGWGVYGRLFNRSNTTLFVPSSPAKAIPDTGTAEATLNVSNNAIITDLNVRLELRHASPSDLSVHLISPTGTDVELFTGVPGPLSNGALPQGSDFSGTLFDDSAAVAINDPDNGAVPPFAGTFQPMGSLAAFNGENVNGQWRLRITDSNGNDRSGILEQWSLIAERSPAIEQEFRVNTTSVGNQTYSSVAMDHQGEFVVTWSGFGNQPEHEDTSGSGVFLQRFQATGNRIGDESRVNMTTEGDQAIPSASSDGVGNFYIAYTGVRRDSVGNNIPGQTDVYVLASNSNLILQDNDPPIVTDVQLTDGTRLLQGDVVSATTNGLLVILSESMSQSGMSSIEDTSNWDLERNGAQLLGAIESIDFRWNATTRKYEAALTLTPSVLPLAAGQYQLTASSVITDGVNSLDGDLDGIPGSNPTTTTQPGYQFRFNVTNSPFGDSVGAEYRVNQQTGYEDRFSAAHGTGTARETSSHTMAVDHDGDYVVVWTRYGADDPNDPSGAGVYMRMFDRNDEPLTNEILVNTSTIGHQRNPSVAMDADGDLVVVWESANSSDDGSYDVYGRRFNSVGTALDSTQFIVNTTKPQNQVNPAVAMNDEGDFVVVWATAGQQFSFDNDIHGQRYDRFGDRQGLEFLVNDLNLPGIAPPPGGSFEINPAVAMGGPSGNFVVAWENVTAQQDGVVTDTVLAARQFGATGFPIAPSFAADTGVGTGGGDTFRVARNPQLVVDDQDGFLIVWESYTGADYDVFYQQFDATAAAVASAQVNMAQFLGQQVNPSVAIDADGDFAIVFNGAGAQPDPLAPNNPALYADEDAEGIWIRRFDATSTPISVQSRVNATEGGIQQFPTIGMEPDGDRIVAWSGRGIGDHNGIFVRRYDEAVDTAGPRLTEFRLVDGRLVDTDVYSPGGALLHRGDPVPARPDQLVVVFDEELSLVGNDSVENVDNWRMERGGVNVSSRIQSVEFRLGTTNKWEALLTFDAPLAAGEYRIQVNHPIPDVPGTVAIEGQDGIRDVVGNPLGRTGANPGGQSYAKTFRISSSSGGNGSVTDGSNPPVTDAHTHFETPNSVALDADGDNVTVLTATGPGGLEKVYYRLFDSNGLPKTELIPVAAEPGFATDIQRLGSVATDADGDFVVSWTNYRGTDADVYARRFRSDGVALGSAFRVNTFGAHGTATESVQKWSDVAMDIDGDFVVTWSSYGQEQAEEGNPAFGYGIYARRYDSFGQALSPEFRVNLTTVGDQQFPSVAMDAQGGFFVAWTSDANGLGEDIIGRSYYPDGSPIPVGQGILGEQTINLTRAGNQRNPDVAMNLAGDNVVVTWSSANQDGSGWGVFGRRFQRNQDPLIFAQQPLLTYTSDDPTIPLPLVDPPPGPGRATTRSTLNVTDSFFVADLDMGMTIYHPDPRDLEVYLISPAGTRVQMVDNVPTGNIPSWDPTLPINGNGFIGTVFNDEASTLITNPNGTPAAVPTFTDLFIPEERLREFDGENALGTWTLEIIDTVGGIRGTFVAGPAGTIFQPDPLYGWVEHGQGELDDWSLTFTQALGGGEFQANDTANGNQLYSSVAMDQSGDFVITWSGRGDQEFQEDESGVFYKRYDAMNSPLSGETRVNTDTEGRQWLPSVGMDAIGNFVITYTGDDGQIVNDVFAFQSTEHVSMVDEAGPLVTDILLPNGERLLAGDSVPAGVISQLTFLFSEQLAETGPGSVEDLGNWSLVRNGTELPGAVANVSFSLNPVTGKYQALLTLDGNGDGTGTPTLGEGEYILTAENTIHDAYVNPDIDPIADPTADPFLGANSLLGDFDVGPGVASGSTGERPFTITFRVSAGAEARGEVRVNDVSGTNYRQSFAESFGTGQAKERAPRAVAIDDDGDFAVVWTSYGQDDPNDPISGGIYMRLYDRNDNPLTGEILVNQTTLGQQRNAAVSMDADGDLVVAWESEGADGLDVYARRFSSVGAPLDDEFRVNTDVTETSGDQYMPAVSMDDFGNFVIVWASRQGQDFSYFHDVYAQRYDLKGIPVGPTIEVNEVNIPGVSLLPGSHEVNPTVALHESGGFVVAWEQVVGQINGEQRDTNIVARAFDADGLPTGDPAANLLGNEFRVDDSSASAIVDLTHTGVLDATASDDLHRTARNPQIAMDAAGNYIIVWESFHDNDVEDSGQVDSYGIYFHEFNADHSEARPAVDHQANLVITTGPGTAVPDPAFNSDKYALSQVNPSIALDADGDFAIVWNGNGATADAIDPDNASQFAEWDREGVFVREFHAGIFDPIAPLPASDSVFATPQSRVNRTEGGIQQFPSIAMTPAGDYVVAWSGAGVGDRQGIFFRRYDQSTDTAGPLATELRTMDGRLIDGGDNVFANPASLVVVFNEQMSTSGGATGFYSVLNPQNWVLVDGRGAEQVNAISKVDFGLNPLTNKWEAKVTFNPAQYPTGLANGYYTLTARTEMRDMSNNPLARTGVAPTGSGLTFMPPTSPTGGMGFTFRIHELTPGDPNVGDLDPIVNTTPFGDKYDPAVARNADGRYVAVWTQESGELVDPTDPTSTVVFSTDIYARMFDADDEPVRNRFGNDDAFVVNSLTLGDQTTPDVAIDDNGNFVVVWSGRGLSSLGEQDDEGIFGQVFAANGDLIGGQFGINQTADGTQEAPAVAMNSTGDFVVTWRSHDQNGIMARQFKASGAQTNEFRVNTTLGNDQQTPDVAIDNDGDFTIVWAAAESNGSQGVFAQRYNASAAKVGGEFHVNQYQTDMQEMPRIAMDDAGNFVVAWQSFGQDEFGGYGIYARRYTETGSASSEFQVNDFTAGYQIEPAVAMDSNGDFVVTWSSFGHEGDRGDLYGIFAKMYNADGSLFVVPGQTTPVGEFRINAIVEEDQRNSDVAMDAAGHYAVLWQGISTVTLLADDDTLFTTQQSDIYARFVDPPATLTADGKTLDLIGTPGADTFEFVAGANPGAWTIKVNGETYGAASTVETINFDGMGGNDTVILTGTNGSETVSLRPGMVSFQGTNFTVNAEDVEDVTVDGKGGQDVAELLDSAGNDFMIMKVGETTMVGAGFSNAVLNFEEVQAYGMNGGVDEARIYDSPEADTFTATAEWSKMEGPGYYHRAKGFEIAHGYSTTGSDTAVMHDGERDDKFKYRGGLAKMMGSGFFARAKNFPVINVFADAGGNDYARIFDTASVDKFVGTPTKVQMSSTQADYDLTARMFERVLAYSIEGGDDIARFYDSADREVFVGNSHKAEFFNDNFEITARKFEQVQATGTPGSGDIAKFRDTVGDDHLVVDEASAKMYHNNGEDMDLMYEVFAFDQVKTYRSSGNDTKDVADTVDFLLLDDGWIDS